MAKKFNIGNRVVFLDDDASPIMVVTGYYMDGFDEAHGGETYVFVEWADLDHKPRREKFHHDLLELYQEGGDLPLNIYKG
ncbi:MAG: hypothetical protein IPJ60_02095 [Sphingobacteriaceae bacterium]|nr:hypothetical protein [Sphingobacteriaceae bacterium]